MKRKVVLTLGRMKTGPTGRQSGPVCLVPWKGSRRVKGLCLSRWSTATSCPATLSPPALSWPMACTSFLVWEMHLTRGGSPLKEKILINQIPKYLCYLIIMQASWCFEPSCLPPWTPASCKPQCTYQNSTPPPRGLKEFWLLGLGLEIDFGVKAPQNEVLLALSNKGTPRASITLQTEWMQPPSPAGMPQPGRRSCLYLSQNESGDWFALLNRICEKPHREVIEGEVRLGRQRRGKGILGRKDRPCRERRWMESCWNSGCSIVGVTGVEPGDAKTSMFLVLHPWGAALGLAQMNGSIKTSG